LQTVVPQGKLAATPDDRPASAESPMLIRDACELDQAGILDIYNEAVLNTTAVWNETPRSLDEQRRWFDDKRAQAYPVLVAADGDAIAGFCSYGPFRAWYGYRFSVENSIYVSTSYRRQGIAQQLLDTLVQRARQQGMHVIVAGIEAENTASIRLHERGGYTVAGCVHEVGFKFGRWLDLLIMERRL
jgi:L-amino acid N-acyltransferase YncA